MFLVAFVCMYVCKQHYSESIKQTAIKLYGGVQGGKMNTCVYFGGCLCLRR